MRHRKTTPKLSRNHDSRKALLKNLAESLIVYEHITTTEAKAKAVRILVERLITKSKDNTLAARRYCLQRLPTETATKKLMEVLGPRYQNRPGGYTRILKTGNRKGDNAPRVIIELV